MAINQLSHAAGKSNGNVLLIARHLKPCLLKPFYNGGPKCLDSTRANSVQKIDIERQDCVHVGRRQIGPWSLCNSQKIEYVASVRGKLDDSISTRHDLHVAGAQE